MACHTSQGVEICPNIMDFSTGHLVNVTRNLFLQNPINHPSECYGESDKFYYEPRSSCSFTRFFLTVYETYAPILFKFGMQIPYRQLCSVYYMVFTIKGQTKAAAAFKVISAIY